MKKIFVSKLFAGLFLPWMVFAADTELDDIVIDIVSIANTAITFLFVAATVVFIWGLVQYVLAGSSEQKKKEGYNLIIWSLVSLFVIVAVWGLVKVLENTFDVDRGTIPVRPGSIDFD